MGLFRKIFPHWEPLVCKPGDVVDLMQECLDINVPSCRLMIEHNGAAHNVGVTSDYDGRTGFFDIVFYLDKQEFRTLEHFCQEAEMDGIRFVALDTVKVLKDIDAGDPREYPLLKKREIR